MRPKHAPEGEWEPRYDRFFNEHSVVAVSNSGNEMVCTVNIDSLKPYTGEYSQAAQSTARLLSAAPDLGEQLLEVYEWLQSGDYEPSFIGPIERALRKAGYQLDGDPGN